MQYGTSRSESGFTLIEVMVATVLIALCVGATAPLFVYAMQQNASSADRGAAGAAAVRRMELLREAFYYDLIPGGDLESNLPGYSDTGDPDYVVRWVIVDNPNPPDLTKVIAVRVIAAERAVGPDVEVTLVTLRGG